MRLHKNCSDCDDGDEMPPIEKLIDQKIIEEIKKGTCVKISGGVIYFYAVYNGEEYLLYSIPVKDFLVNVNNEADRFWDKIKNFAKRIAGK